MGTNGHDKKAAFLAAMAECGTISQAADAAGCHRNSHYQWMENDPEYAGRYEEACKRSNDRLEAEARRRAIEGWEEPVYRMGQLVGVKRKFSDTLLIFLLKGNNPEKFGDKVTQTHKGDAKSPVVLFELPRNGREADREG